MIVPIAVGLALAIGLALLATTSGLDRDRGYYPVVLIVIAWYYVLFAVMSGSTPALLFESIGMVVFTTVAIIGFRSNLWLAVAGIAAHGVFDAVHGRLIANAGVPAWWPAFCGSIDVGIAMYAAWLLASRRKARP